MGVLRVASFVRYGFFGLLFVSNLILSSTAISATRTVTPAPGDIQRTYQPGSGGYAFFDSASWAADVAVQNNSGSGSTSVQVNNTNGYSNSTFRNALKRFVKATPAAAVQSAAMAGAFAALDWLFDPENNQFKKELTSPPPSDGSYPTGQGYPEWEMAGKRGGSPDDAWQKVVHQDAFYGAECELLTATTARCAVRVKQGNNIYAWQHGGLANVNAQCPSGYAKQASGCFITAFVPVTSLEIDSWADSVLDPQFAADVAPHIREHSPTEFDTPDSTTFTGPSSLPGDETTTTTTNPSTGDTTVTTSSPTYNFDYSTNPLSVTSNTTYTTNTYQNGTLTSTSTTATNDGTTVVTPSPSTEVPTDCEFMPTVCAFIDWIKTPFDESEPDLTQFISDEEYTKDFNISSNSQCPAPATLQTAFGSFEFSYEPACMWAGMIKPFVLVAALISAIFISLGAIRGSD